MTAQTNAPTPNAPTPNAPTPNAPTPNAPTPERHGPGEAAHDGKARHGYRNEVSWDGGAGRQPYANQKEGQQGPAAAHESAGGDRAAASGRNLEQLEQVKGTPP